MAVKHEELWIQWRQEGEIAARDLLVEHYLWLIRYVAGRLMVGLPAQFDQDDVEGHGTFGLLDALQRYDYERGIRFETFAIPWIRGACLEGIRALQWAPALRKRVRQLERAQGDLQVILGRDPTEEELAAHLHISLHELEKRMAESGCLSILSLEEVLFDEDGNGASLKERLEDPDAPDPMASTEMEERREMLALAIDALPDQERLVVSLFYYEGLVAREISDLLGLSQARISQVHSKAILRLRGRLARLKALLVS